MENTILDFGIEKLGDCQISSPLVGVQFIDDNHHIIYHNDPAKIKVYFEAGKEPPAMEVAGPREKIFFNPTELKCGIVTCGGLCPGLNDVIRAIVMSLFFHYGAQKVFGFPYGFEGLVPAYGHTPVEFTTQLVSEINKLGGTFLGSSRGPQDISVMVDTLERMGINILFTVGGDGTLRGATAISEEIKRRGLKIAIIGIPKTIDNDISFIDRSFGFITAGSEARKAISSAHAEASGARNGVGLVKLMGRDSGFIAAYAALADNEVNFCLIPETPFSLDVFLDMLQKRLQRKGHAVVVAAEGAGQNLLGATGERDASGNMRFNDIGIFLREKIKEHFSKINMEMTLKYIDPSYIIRSIPADASDAAFCLLLGHNAVHAGMTGRTNMVVGHWQNEFSHVPIPMAVSRRKKIDPRGWVWSSVLAATGQPADMQ